MTPYLPGTDEVLFDDIDLIDPPAGLTAAVEALAEAVTARVAAWSEGADR